MVYAEEALDAAEVPGAVACDEAAAPDAVAYGAVVHEAHEVRVEDHAFGDEVPALASSFGARWVQVHLDRHRKTLSTFNNTHFILKN